jgi:tetratricopeptide (TPR) repeat protein
MDMENKEQFEEKNRTAASRDSSQPSNGNSANSSANGSQSSDSSTNQSASQNPSQEDKATKAEEEKLSPKQIEGLKPEQNQAPLNGLAVEREERTPDAEQFLADYPEENKSFLDSFGLIVGGGIIIGLVAVAFFLNLPEPPEVDSSSKVAEKSTQNTEVDSSLKVEEKSTQNPKVEKTSKELDLTKPANMLQQCKQHFEAGRLTMGNEGTALACYKEVLNLESSNAVALAGLQEIKVRYVRGIDTASKYEQSKMRQRLEQSLDLVEKELGKEVDVLLKTCRTHFGAGKKDSALICYQYVLKLDADNDFALDGIKAIIGVEVYVELQKCQKHFEANRLTSGIGGNALACYKKILEQDPVNDDAQKGLKAIAKRYEKWAYKALRQRKFNKAKGYLPSLEKVDPHSSILADLKRRLKIK